MKLIRIVPSVALAAFATACGSSAGTTTPPAATTTPAPTVSPTVTPNTTTPAPSTTGADVALSADAASAATGDIPDNQVFLTFDNPTAGYSMRYPEGWAQRGDGNDVVIADKNNIVRVVIAGGAAPTVDSVNADLAKLEAANPSLKAPQPTAVTIKGTPAIKVTYTTVSEPNAVTGKTVTLVVDRYVLGAAGKVATIDLGTPKGVDNVDGYRLMIESFSWK